MTVFSAFSFLLMGVPIPVVWVLWGCVPWAGEGC